MLCRVRRCRDLEDRLVRLRAAHPELLAAQRIPQPLATKKVWKQRFEDINNVERYLTRNGTVIRKFFLHVSREEQRKRFLERLDTPEKHWKFSMADAHERTFWKDYMSAYEDMIQNTASPHAPWFVVPADNKWFTRLVVAAAVIEALEEMELAFPQVDGEKRKELAQVRRALESENSKGTRSKGAGEARKKSR